MVSKTIDTHQHNWQVSRFNYAWIEPATLLGRDYLPDEAIGIMQDAQVDHCVLVEAGANSSGEMHWFLQLASEYPHIAGVVAWIDLKQDVESVLAKIDPNHRSYLKGVRINVVDPHENWAVIADGLDVLERHNLTCDLLVGGRMLRHIQPLIEAHPGVTFILDHFGGVRLTPDGFTDWKEALRPLAKLPNVVMKVSGYLTAAVPSPLTSETFAIYVDIALEQFGANRLMYGSDWPVCLQGGTYADTINLLRTTVSALSDDVGAQIRGETAVKIYHLDV